MQNCKQCNGTGFGSDDFEQFCPSCRGTGLAASVCEACGGAGKVYALDDPAERKCQQCDGTGYTYEARSALDNLLRAQQVFGKLEFTLNSDRTYSKEYAVGTNGIVKIVPIFDTSMNGYKLTGFNAIYAQRIGLNEYSKSSLLPKECKEDLTSIIISLTKKIIQEKHIIEVQCSKCNKISTSFVDLDCYTCIDCYLNQENSNV